MSHAMTKRQLREQRRAERQAAERAAAAHARRKRRLWQLAASLGLAVAVVGVAIAVSSGGAKPRSPSQAATLFAGIPETGGVLGDASAPVTVTEFVDLQCPICAEASHSLLPSVVDDYVRTGKVKLQARTLHFIGPDSVRAARVAAGAERQGRLWPFLEAFYAAQKTENSGYVTDAFLRSVASASGVNAGKALAFAGTAASQKPLTQANAEAGKLNVNATPTFAVKRGNGPVKVVSAQDLQSVLATTA